MRDKILYTSSSSTHIPSYCHTSFVHLSYSMLYIMDILSLSIWTSEQKNLVRSRLQTVAENHRHPVMGPLPPGFPTNIPFKIKFGVYMNLRRAGVAECRTVRNAECFFGLKLPTKRPFSIKVLLATPLNAWFLLSKFL